MLLMVELDDRHPAVTTDPSFGAAGGTAARNARVMTRANCQACVIRIMILCEPLEMTFRVSLCQSDAEVKLTDSSREGDFHSRQN